ncbi:hypothetical protein JHK86_052931 [Glycine max]|nr:hypothetical protein JHK86_052931 [Glycine max]
MAIDMTNKVGKEIFQRAGELNVLVGFMCMKKCQKHRLSWKMDDDSTAHLVFHAYNLTKLDIPRSHWGCQIIDAGLLRISFDKCISNVTSISLWGLTSITNEGVVQLVFQQMMADDASLSCYS